MINQAEVDRLYDCDVIDSHGERIGSVKQVWLDDRDGRPIWASVHTGLFGIKESFVPIQDAQIASGHITVPVEKQQVKDAPRIDVNDEHMSDKQQEELYSYYGLIPTANTGQHDRLPRGGKDTRTEERSVRGNAADQRGTVQRPTDPRAADQRRTADADVAGKRGEPSVTRYEEKLDVGTRDVEAGRVRLVKHVVTEQKTVTVPVSHEEVRVVREPADGKGGGGAFTEEEAEVTLRRQEAVVNKRAEAVEKVRLDKETVTEQREVADSVRREQVDVERDDAGRARTKKDDRA
ncbi:DUF2382 domain-containing protein [Actinosynnema sp. NPDC023587]|uniref:DUF2382 domain-containing protein n=1 Tax=Actinosynnema sp. NPDC023587 TaxID=3154695 RepID=UPI0033F98A02